MMLWLVALLEMMMKTSGFSRSAATTAEAESFHHVSPLTATLAHDLDELTTASWNGRAVFHGQDPDLLQSKIAKVTSIIKNNSIAVCQELHCCDELMSGAFRQYCGHPLRL